MRIKNPSMAGQALRLRFSGERLELDANGEGEVPDKDGLFLCATPGWTEAKAKGSRQPVAVPVAPPVPPPELPAPEPEVAAPELEEPAAPAEVAPTEPPPSSEGEGSEDEGPDIEAIRTKRAALAVAEDYGVDLDPEAKLSEMKARLDAEIYGDD